MSHTLMKESIAQEARRLGSVNDQPTSLCVCVCVCVCRRRSRRAHNRDINNRQRGENEGGRERVRGCGYIPYGSGVGLETVN